MQPEVLYDSAIQQALRQIIYENQLLFIDGWTFVHATSGLVLGYLITRFVSVKYALAIGMAVLIGYEIIEPIFNGLLFVPEDTKDVAWDIIVGGVMLYLSYKLTKKKIWKKQHLAQAASGE